MATLALGAVAEEMLNVLNFLLSGDAMRKLELPPQERFLRMKMFVVLLG